MKLLLSLGATALTGLVLGACAQAPRNIPHPPPFPKAPAKNLFVAASVSDSAIAIDGSLEDAWAAADAKVVYLKRGVDGTPAFPVILRALYSEDYVYISARWPDLEADEMPKRYVWNESQLTYEPSNKTEDMLALAFELQGDLQVSMLTTKSYIADVWHWKAGRGNAVGYADDKRNIISDKEIPGHRSHSMELYDGSMCWIARPADAGDAMYRKRDAPREFEANKFVPSYEQVKPSGSRADVMAKGVHHNGRYWTLEFKRKRNTGTDDDVIFRARKDLPMTVAVWNDSRDLDHAYSEILHLRLEPPRSSSE